MLYLQSSYFNPQGSREPRPNEPFTLTASIFYFNPQGSREPRRINTGAMLLDFSNFNPQGSREPRRTKTQGQSFGVEFQSTRLSRASTLCYQFPNGFFRISIHKALASLDALELMWPGLEVIFQSTRLSRASTGLGGGVTDRLDISIHKALASLDFR